MIFAVADVLSTESATGEGRTAVEPPQFHREVRSAWTCTGANTASSICRCPRRQTLMSLDSEYSSRRIGGWWARCPRSGCLFAASAIAKRCRDRCARTCGFLYYKNARRGGVYNEVLRYSVARLRESEENVELRGHCGKERGRGSRDAPVPSNACQDGHGGRRRRLVGRPIIETSYIPASPSPPVQRAPPPSPSYPTPQRVFKVIPSNNNQRALFKLLDRLPFFVIAEGVVEIEEVADTFYAPFSAL
ncbi:hypothetical protein EJ02DRAFT_508901 [Clathrospora elynae]|uniref:Uncharacterized protein n=1 Tax=Clathrospora elynae TaxID=706981 RepID=A0A6A5SZF1_9PLEO|nr:hypothetical protein EJ02DRAFT_508901 [Clathrospora elynae]